MNENKILKITSILMIVGGVLSVLGAALLIAFGGLVFSSVDAAGFGVVLGFIAVIGPLVAGVIQLVAGIVGKKNCANPAKAGTCIALGVVICIISILSTVANLSGDANTGSIILNLAVGLVLPGLYTYGAYQLKASA